MTVLYQNLYNDNVCYKWTALYIVMHRLTESCAYHTISNILYLKVISIFINLLIHRAS